MPLKALSNNRDAVGYVRAMAAAQTWSAGFDYEVPRAELEAAMAGSNAFREERDGFKLVIPNFDRAPRRPNGVLRSDRRRAKARVCPRLTDKTGAVTYSKAESSTTNMYAYFRLRYVILCRAYIGDNSYGSHTAYIPRRPRICGPDR
jgi:hypothetical protein